MAISDPHPSPTITIGLIWWFEFNLSLGDPEEILYQFPIHSTQRAGLESRHWYVESHGLSRGVIGMYYSIIGY